ncbi:MAG: T9SS type A sorting domain-containing protein [Bacteroidales bacterium]|nr:T9SS type A sorting domain-containing protein [Bacteroidales bacterium]
MKKSLHKDLHLKNRLKAYSATAGAILVLSPTIKGQIIHSGIQNIQLNMPDDFYELDMNDDAVNDFTFLLGGYSSIYTTGSISVWYGFGYAVIYNAKTDSYNNSWMFHTTNYASRIAVHGLSVGSAINGTNTMWSNTVSPHWPGVFGLGYRYLVYTASGTNSYAYGYGDFFGTQKFVGVRFYIGADQHYGWIRVRLGDYIYPLTVIDWAYESTPETGILAGDGGDTDSPVPTLTADPNTDQQTVTVGLSFNEPVQGLEQDHFVVINGVASNLNELTEGEEYTLDVTANSQGSVSVELPYASVTDSSGNPNLLAYTSWVYEVESATENIADNRVIIFPNPAKDKLFLNLKNASDISVVNISGELIYSRRKVLYETIDVSQYAPGIYIVNIENKDELYHKKILIE